MAVPDYRVCVGTVARNTVTGNQVISGIASAAGAFTPKAILFWTTYQSAPGYTDDGRFGFGWTDGVLQMATATFKESNAVNRGTRAYMTPLYCLAANTSAPTLISDAAQFVSFGLGACTISWESNSGTPWNLHYMAFGGADLSVQAGAFLNNGTGGGNQTVAANNLGQVTGVLFVNVLSLVDNSTGVATIACDNLPILGATDGVNQIGLSTAVENFVSTTSTYGQAVTTDTIIAQDFGGGHQKGAASIVSLGVGAFTVDWTQGMSLDVFGNAGTYFLAFAGVPMNVQAYTQPGGPARQTLATSNFTPAGTLVCSIGHPASTGVQSDLRWSLGAVDDQDNQVASWLGDLTGQITSQASRGMRTDHVLLFANPAIPGSASTPLASATAVIVTGGVTLNWDVSDGVLREGFAVSWEATTVEPPPPVPPSGCEVPNDFGTAFTA